MSSCELSVRLNGQARDVAGGGDVTGTVTVTAGGPTEPANLHVRQLWRAHGRGNTHETVVEERVEVLPRLVPGAPYEVPFRFRAPDMPVTYHGHLINVDHYVHARIDKPWARDVVAEADYLVAPGPASAEAYRLGKAAGAKEGTAKTPGCLKVIGWVLLPLILVLLIGLALMLIPILIVAGIAVLVRRSLAEKRLGRVTAELSAPTLEEPGAAARAGGRIAKLLGHAKGRTYVAAPGETVTVALRFIPPVDVTLTGATVEVAATEAATSGSGTDATTHREVLWARTVTLLEARTLMRGVPVDATAPVELPWVGAYSLDVPSNKLAWTAKFRVDIPGWPDWVHEDEIRVIPPR